MKTSEPEEMDYHALNAMFYVQTCSKLSVPDCMKDRDFCVFVWHLIDSYPTEWEFFNRVIARRNQK